MNKNIFFLLFLIPVIAFISCNNDSKSKVQDENKIKADTSLNELPKDFTEFYTRFHSDSVFQMAHITFPLEGAIRAPEEETDSMIPYRWRKDKWQLHHEFDSYNNIFTRRFYLFSDNLIIEKITGVNDLFKMERRFGKLHDGWNLIYYSVN